MKNLQTFEKILIAVDDSKYAQCAAAYGFSLAKKLNASVSLVHINEYPIATNLTGDPILGDTTMVLPNIMDIQQDHAKSLFQNLKATYAPDGIVEEYILEGDTTNEIVNLAKEQNFSMIVIGTHSRTGFDHFISGSVASSVSRHANCPVFIVPFTENI